MKRWFLTKKSSMFHPVIRIDSTHVESFDAKHAMSSRRPSNQEIAANRDSEGLIPVVSADSEIYYILDCPSLHMVEGRYLFPEGSFLGENVYFDLLLIPLKLTLIRCIVRSRNIREFSTMPPMFWQLWKGEKNTCRTFCSTSHSKDPSLAK